MPRKKNDLNTIYISERLQEKLSDLPVHPDNGDSSYGLWARLLFCFVNWYLNERVKKDHGVVIRISIYTNSLPIFWKSVQNAFRFAGFDFFEEYECPSDPASGGLFADDLSPPSGRQDRCIFLLTIFIFLRMQGSVNSSVHYQGGSRKMFIW